MKNAKVAIYAEQRELKEQALEESKAKLNSLLKPNPTEEKIAVVNALVEKIDNLIQEIEEIRLCQKFNEHIEIWVDELDASYSGMVFSATLNDLKKLRTDYKYANELINIIGRSFQELEILIRGYLFKKGLPQKRTKRKPQLSTFLKEIDEANTFSKKQMITLRKIIKLRNWLTHDVIKEERAYTKKHINSFSGIVNMNEWTNYYYTKVAITKNMLYEAIDLFNNYEGSALKNL